MKMYKFLGLMAVAGLALTACNSDDDDNVAPIPTPVPGGGGAATPACVYVLGTGNEGYAIDGGVMQYNPATNAISSNLFSEANGRSLGITSNDMTASNNIGYVAVTASNTIEIFSLPSAASIKQISLVGQAYEGPRHIVAADNYVFATMKSGHMARIDTRTQEIDKVVAFTPLAGSYAGTYPEGMAVVDGKVYVALSGMGDQLENRVAVVDAATMNVDGYITVATNLTDIYAVNGHLYALSAGWYDAYNGYAQTDAGLYEFDATGSHGLVCNATMAQACGDNIYYINAPYAAATTSMGVFNTTNGTNTTLLSPAPGESHSAFGVAPDASYLLVGSNQLGDYGYADYQLPGYIVRYDMANGQTTKIETEVYGIARFIFQ